MKHMDVMDRHSQLVGRMSDTLGADLGAALAEGQLTGEQYRAAVMRCSSCLHESACGAWLKDHAAGAEATPAYCRNSDLMHRLAAG